MNSDSFSWLHLSDFHYGLRGQDCLWPTLRQPFLESLGELHEHCGPWDVVFFTGDLVQTGRSEEFAGMEADVLNRLWQKLHELGSGDAALLATPGNHDLFRPSKGCAAVDMLLLPNGFSHIAETFWTDATCDYRRVISDSFAAYSEWWENESRRPKDLSTSSIPGDFACTLERTSRKIGVVGLNTTFLQLTGGDYKGRLVWNASQIQAVCGGAVDDWTQRHEVCLLLTHQGPTWLTPEAAEHGESEIAPAGRFAVHLFGHQHDTDITYFSKGGGRTVRRLQGNSAFGMEMFGDPPATQRIHGYAAGRIEFGLEESTLRVWPRVATNQTGRWRFIPDYKNAELGRDQGTAPHVIAVRNSDNRSSSRNNKESLPNAIPVSYVQPSAPHSTLPGRRPFFGRANDLKKVAKCLLPEDRSWGVVIDGPGGIGKTALALESAYLAPVEHFPLKLWITAKKREMHPEGERKLRDHGVNDYFAFLDELGRSLGRDDIPKATREARPKLLRHALAEHRALLVLDNLESFTADEQRRVFELLGNLPGPCRAIVTTRRRTDRSFAAHFHRLDRLERAAAGELLTELGQRWTPISQLTPADCDRLYVETGGNPLLLTWTVGQLGRNTGRCRTVDEAVTRLQEAHSQKKPNGRNDPLDFVFGDLVESFTDEEAAVIASLVHFTQPAPIEWLAPLADLSYKAAETALDDLRDRALLVEDYEASTWLLPPLAAHFLRQTCPEVVGVTGERLANHAAELAVDNGFENGRLDVLESAWPQLSAAFPLWIDGDNERLQTVCNALEDYLNFYGRWDDWLSLSIEAEIRAERDGDFDNAGWRASDAGWCHYLRDQAGDVLRCAERALRHWRAAGASARACAFAVRLRGLAHQLAKDYPAAIAAFRKALELWSRPPSNDEEVAIGLNNLAAALRESGQLDEAEPYYREAITLAESIPDPDGIAAYTGQMAELALDREQWSEAESLARRALTQNEQLSNKEGIALNSRRLAIALAKQGRAELGYDYAELAVTLFTHLGSPELDKAAAALDVCQSRSISGARCHPPSGRLRIFDAALPPGRFWPVVSEH